MLNTKQKHFLNAGLIHYAISAGTIESSVQMTIV
jgi:hypothetical protein